MPLGDAALVVELVPHCDSVPREGWTASHDARPLSELGQRQAVALVTALGVGIDALNASPTVRCRQTVEPLATATGLPIDDLAALYEAGDFGEPAAGTEGVSDLMVTAVGGGWFTLRFGPGALTVTSHHAVALAP